MKKVLATILALVMALGVTTMAWATETEGGITVQIGDGEKKSCSTLAEAIEAVNTAKGTDKVVLTLKANEPYTWTQPGGIKIARSNVEVNGNDASVTLSGVNTYAWIGDSANSSNKLIAAVVLVQGDNVTLRNLTVKATYPSNNVAAVGARKNSSTDQITGLKLENVTADNQEGSTVGAICLQNVNDAKISGVKTKFEAADGTNPDVQLSNSTLTVGDDNVLARGYITGDAASTVKLNDNVVVDVAGAVVKGQDLSKAPIEVKNDEDVRYFSSLRYALMNTASGSSVKLNGDVTVPDGAVTATCAAADIEFDGQGYKITAAGGMHKGVSPAIIASKGNSTFKDIKIEFQNSSNIVTAIRVTGGDTVDNVKITATGARGTTTISNMAVYGQNCAEGTTVTIKNCEFDGMFYGYYTDATNSHVVLENNTFNCPYVSVLYNTGKSTITGNTVNNAKLSIADGDVTITKNTFENNSEIKYYGENVDMKLTENNIIGKSKVVIKKTPAQGKTLDLTNNYWGGTTPSGEQITGDEGVSEDVVNAAREAADGAYKTTKVNIGGEQTPPQYYYYPSTPSISAVLNGSNKSATDYTSGDYGLVFRSTAAFSTFQGVQVDGKTLAKSNYTAEEGSIVVYLKAAYLKTLAAGKHTVTILSTSGNAAMDFTIGGKTDSPKTFDAGVGIYAVTAVLSVTGMAWVGKKRH